SQLDELQLLKGAIGVVPTPTNRWYFKLIGCSNRKCDNCSCLDGEWVLVWEDRGYKGGRWIKAMDTSFADPKRPSFWRLFHCTQDGFWYLDCVQSLEQPPGTWICYRRHESAWAPHGSNVMHLVTHNEYCNVPESIALAPA